jgi:fructokinase
LGRVIVVAGEALIDVVIEPDGTSTPYPGGGPYNAARTMARLGQKVGFLGRISDDPYGRLLRGRLEADGVRTDLVAATSDPTTIVRAEVDPDGAARYDFDLDGTSAPGLTWADARRALQPPPRAFHAGTLGLTVRPIADTVAHLVRALPADTLVMVDVNCRPGAVTDPRAYRERMRSVLRRAEIVKASAEDLDFLAPDRPHADTVADILRDGTRALLLTRGGQDVLVATGTGTFERPVPAVDVVDTIGAGDAFGGGFLARWIGRGRGREDLADRVALDDAVAFAIRVAAITCQRPGADPPWAAELGPP